MSDGLGAGLQLSLGRVFGGGSGVCVLAARRDDHSLRCPRAAGATATTTAPAHCLRGPRAATMAPTRAPRGYSFLINAPRNCGKSNNCSTRRPPALLTPTVNILQPEYSAPKVIQIFNNSNNLHKHFITCFLHLKPPVRLLQTCNFSGGKSNSCNNNKKGVRIIFKFTFNDFQYFINIIRLLPIHLTGMTIIHLILMFSVTLATD